MLSFIVVSLLPEFRLEFLENMSLLDRKVARMTRKWILRLSRPSVIIPERRRTRERTDLGGRTVVRFGGHFRRD